MIIIDKNKNDANDFFFCNLPPQKVCNPLAEQLHKYPHWGWSMSFPDLLPVWDIDTISPF